MCLTGTYPLALRYDAVECCGDSPRTCFMSRGAVPEFEYELVPNILVNLYYLTTDEGGIQIIGFVVLVFFS
jgi:hypothetical protein